MLILRPRRVLIPREVEMLHDFMKRQGMEVVVVPFGIDVLTDPPPLQEPEPADEPIGQDDIEAARAEILDAYNAGKIIQYNPIADPLAGWLDAHQHSSPHDFEWDDNYYRLYSPKR